MRGMAAGARLSLAIPSFEYRYHKTLLLLRCKSTRHIGRSDAAKSPTDLKTLLLLPASDQVGNKQQSAVDNDGAQVEENSNKAAPPLALSCPPEHYFDTHQIVTRFQTLGIASYNYMYS